jgi:uncharacterized protein YaaR (DUF327 family)
MANEQNLVKGDEAHKLTAEEQSRGGKKSAEVRRQKKLLKDYLQDVLDDKISVKDSNGKKTEMDTAKAITVTLVKQAIKGNVKAYTTIRDTLGQAPIQGINLTSEVGDDGLLSALEKGLSEDGDK